jgi:hypothetical protein
MGNRVPILMLEALIEGKADPAAMADLAKRRMRAQRSPP